MSSVGDTFLGVLTLIAFAFTVSVLPMLLILAAYNLITRMRQTNYSKFLRTIFRDRFGKGNGSSCRRPERPKNDKV